MNRRTAIAVISPPETALKKLSAAQIEVFWLKKEGARTTFCVKDNNLKKVFAIFSRPCYNICVIKYGAASTLLRGLLRRWAFVAGGVLFAAAAALSQLFVLNVEVTGSGAYLAPQVEALLSEHGCRVGSVWRGASPAAVSAILSLPSVVFCTVQKEGSTVTVDVECAEGQKHESASSPLLAPADGVLKELVVVCGTPAAAEGEQVESGQKLILPYTEDAEGVRTPCLPVGRAEVEVRAEVCTRAEEESDSALANALAAVRLYSEGAEVTSYTVKRADDGVIYVVAFTYTASAAVNMQ